MRVGSLKRVIARLAVVMVAIGAPAMVTATPAQAQYVSVNYFGTLYNFATGGLNVVNGDVQMSTSVHARWWVSDNPPNGHQIATGDGNVCLDSNFAGGVYVMRCNNGKYQRWHFNAIGLRYVPIYGGMRQTYQVINVATGRCLDGNSSDAYTLPCNNGDHQRWSYIA
ncbi:RICIN domain-containing protein [Micromonospora rubida]